MSYSTITVKFGASSRVCLSATSPVDVGADLDKRKPVAHLLLAKITSYSNNPGTVESSTEHYNMRRLGCSTGVRG